MDTEGVGSAGMQDDDVARLVALTERKHEIWDQLGNCEDEELRSRLFAELAANRDEIARLKSIVSVLLDEPSASPLSGDSQEPRRSVGETLRAHLLIPEERMAPVDPPPEALSLASPSEAAAPAGQGTPSPSPETTTGVVDQPSGASPSKSVAAASEESRTSGGGTYQDLDRVRPHHDKRISLPAVVGAIAVLLVAAWFLFLKPDASTDGVDSAASENASSEAEAIDQIRAVLAGLGHGSVLLEERDGTLHLAGVVGSDDDFRSVVAASQALAGEMPLDTTGLTVRDENAISETPASTNSATDSDEDPQDSQVAAAPPTGAYIEATLEGKDFVLSGVVPSAALAGSYLRAAEVAYSPYVRSELVVDENLETVEWLDRGPNAIVLLPMIIEGKILIADGQVEVSGRSPDEAAVERIQGALGQVTGLPVSAGDVVVANLDPPSYVMAADAGDVTLTGEIPTEAIRDLLVEAAAAAYGPENVTDLINVNPGVYPSLWMYSGGPLMQAMATFPDYELRIDGMAFSGFINGGVTFEPGSATFSGNYAQVLDVGVSVLTRDPSLQLVIEGHTDDRGSDEANLALSQRRAEAVRDYFIANGIEASRLTAIGVGEAEPVVPNDSEEGRARNRRIQYVLSTSS